MCASVGSLSSVWKGILFCGESKCQDDIVLLIRDPLSDWLKFASMSSITWCKIHRPPGVERYLCGWASSVACSETLWCCL